MLLCLALMWVPAAAVSEEAAFELGHMEGSSYVNPELGIDFDTTGFSGMEAIYVGEDLDESNGCGWNDAPALMQKLDAGEMLTCYVLGDPSMKTAGAINVVQINVQKAEAGAEDAATALLETGRAELEKAAAERGYNLAQADIGEMDFLGAPTPCLTIDVESNGRHKQSLYLAIAVEERVYRINFDMSASEVDGYLSHFSAL